MHTFALVLYFTTRRILCNGSKLTALLGTPLVFNHNTRQPRGHIATNSALHVSEGTVSSVAIAKAGNRSETACYELGRLLHLGEGNELRVRKSMHSRHPKACHERQWKSSSFDETRSETIVDARHR